MGKTRDLFKKIIDTKGTFHAKMGSIKDLRSQQFVDSAKHSNEVIHNAKFYIIFHFAIMNFPDKFSLKKKRKSGENINMGKIRCLK